jgi:hypothetical protein
MIMWHKMVLGHYSNKRQAQSNPSAWPHIHVKYTENEDGTLDFKSWYKYQGENEPYRHFRVEYRYDRHFNCFTTSVNLKTDEASCPFQWGFFDGWWWGEPQGDCILRDTKVISHVRFNGEEYRSRDTGVDPKTGEFRWGLDISDDPMKEFRFVKINNP